MNPEGFPEILGNPPPTPLIIITQSMQITIIVYLQLSQMLGAIQNYSGSVHYKLSTKETD